MDKLSNDLFARARLSGDEHRRIHGSHGGNRSQDPLHGRAFRNKRLSGNRRRGAHPCKGGYGGALAGLLIQTVHHIQRSYHSQNVADFSRFIKNRGGNHHLAEGIAAIILSVHHILKHDDLPLFPVDQVRNTEVDLTG